MPTGYTATLCEHGFYLSTGCEICDSRRARQARDLAMIRAVKAAAVKICRQAQAEAEAEYKGDADTSDFLAEAVMANWCASEIDALSAEAILKGMK